MRACQNFDGLHVWDRSAGRRDERDERDWRERRDTRNQGLPVARLRGRRDLAENLPFRIEPIIERRSTPVPSLTVELMGPLCDQDVQVIAGRQRQCVRLLDRKPVGLLLGSLCFPVRFCRTNAG